MVNFIKSTIVSIVVILGLSLFVSAMAKPKSEQLKFTSSTVCGMCKSSIEKTLQKIDGVLASLVNLNSGKISVKFDPSKTNAEAIKAEVLRSGYFFNETPPTKEAFDKLPECCKAKNKH